MFCNPDGPILCQLPRIRKGEPQIKVKLILPALTEAKSPFWRPIKYSLFPPLGLATLAAYLSDEDTITLQDEHVETLDLDDEPDLVVIEVYITSAYRAYRIADHYRGSRRLCLSRRPARHLIARRGGAACRYYFHGTRGGYLACISGRLPPEEAPELDTFPRSARWQTCRSPAATSSSVSSISFPTPLSSRAGCPHACDFCYKEAFFQGGKSFYTLSVERALAEIESLPGRHLYFLDDHLFGNPRFITSLLDGMRGMGRLWQAAATVQSVLRPGLMELAAASGLRSLFVGFETLNPANLVQQHKYQNLRRDYSAAIRLLHDLGVMVNASFVFGMDDDDGSVFERTVDWAISQGIETATFHILTPYPGTALHQRMFAEGRIAHSNWDLYDTRHCVFTPKHLTPGELEAGYWNSYRDFYRWSSILSCAGAHASTTDRLRHLAYAGAWKKLEPVWGWVIRAKRVADFLPLLEAVLGGHRRAAEPMGLANRLASGSQE